jgi:hypothetical protein
VGILPIKRNIVFAGTVLICQIAPFVLAETPPVNSYQNGPIIKGGIYHNTSTGQTTFANTGKAGLWLKAGSTVRALEVGNNGQLTRNGGTVHVYAPGSVVRIDGDVDASGARGLSNGGAYYRGDGGTVFIDAAYVYQSGRVLANGTSGGLIEYNVGSATFTDQARVEAQGSFFPSGSVGINASGVVDIGKDVVFNTAGATHYALDHNVINIEGGMINLEGRLIADGVNSRGGTVRLVSMGQTDLARAQEGAQDGIEGGTFTPNEGANLAKRLEKLVENYNGDIRIASPAQTAKALISVNGNQSVAYSSNDTSDPDERAGDGGTISITAARDVLNGGHLLANGFKSAYADLPNNEGVISAPGNGGNGGTVQIAAGRTIVNSGRIVTDGGEGRKTYVDFFSNQPVTGKGGDGGLIALGYKESLYNSGVIRANGAQGGKTTDVPSIGGDGGLIVLSGPVNPAGSGIVMAIGGHSVNAVNGLAGTVAMFNPSTASNRLFGNWSSTGPMEILTHAENLIFYNQSLTNPSQYDSLSYWLEYGRVRSVRDPAGKTGFGYRELVEKSHLIAIDNPLYQNEVDFSRLSYGGYINNDVYRNLILACLNGQGNTFALRGTYGTNRPYQLETNDQIISIQPTFALKPYTNITQLTTNSVYLPEAIEIGASRIGGHFSSISLNGDHTGDFTGRIQIQEGISGGTVNIASAGSNTDIISILNGRLHGGSVILKALQDINQFYSSDTSGGFAGGTQQYFAGRHIELYPHNRLNGDIMGGTFYGDARNMFVLNGGEEEIELNGAQQKGYTRLKADKLIFGPSCGQFCD